MTQIVRADELTAKFGNVESRRIRRHIFSKLSILAGDLALDYVRTADRISYEQADQALINIHQQLCIEHLNLCEDEQGLRQVAKGFAEKCQRVVNSSTSPVQAYEDCARIARRFHIEPPVIKTGSDPEPALKRVSLTRWWNCRILNLRNRKIEAIARNIELVSRQRGIYASDYTIHTHRRKKEKNRQYLSTTFMENEAGQQFSLQELSDRSVSNPAIRRAELMVRMRGFEQVANVLGHVGEFYTLTTPSRMHACLHSGVPNPRYDGTSVMQAHEYLTHNWSLIRAELARRDIYPYGFRVVEPHHDGTPHWHLMLFMPEHHRHSIRQVMQHYALMDSANEPGALAHRFKAVAIDPEKGTAAGYIAKYISKNIDGHKIEQDLYGNNAATAAERINAWSNIWGIRQFQQIGGPSVTVWRQLRKMDKADDPELETIRKSATASDWAAFMLAMGDPSQTSRRNHPAKPFYESAEKSDPDTGEIFTERNQYGEIASHGVSGIIWNGTVYSTRKHIWMLLKQDSEDVQEGCGRRRDCISARYSSYQSVLPSQSADSGQDARRHPRRPFPALSGQYPAKEALINCPCQTRRPGF